VRTGSRPLDLVDHVVGALADVPPALTSGLVSLSWIDPPRIDRNWTLRIHDVYS
jgi:hypothetical protein